MFEEAQAAAQQAPAVAQSRGPVGYVRPWSANGRQAMMQMRNLMQLPELSHLSLARTKIADSDLAHLKGMEQLSLLSLKTASGMEIFVQAR